MAITWNPLDKGANVTLSNENLTATLGGLHAVRATEGKSTGKWYWEIIVEPNNTGIVVIGVDDGSEVVNHHGSSSGNNAIRMYVSTGEKAGTTRTAYGQTYGANDVIGVALNIDDGIIGFYKNGVYQGDAFNDLAGMSKPIFPRVGSWSSNGVKIVSANFGHKPFKYSIPKGYYSYDGNQYRGNDKILILNDNKTYSLKRINTWHETKMTSNTIPTPFVASASSIYSSSYDAWKAFNGTNIDSSDCWVTANGQVKGWIQIDFGEKKRVNMLSLTSRNYSDLVYSVNAFPKDVIVYGSNDGNNFEQIKSFNSLSVTTYNETITLELPISYYRIYRLEILSNNGHTNYTSIGEILYGLKLYKVINIPSYSEQNFINYGMDSPIQFNGFFTNKNYILQDGVNEDSDGLWKQEINRKPLSIKFE